MKPNIVINNCLVENSLNSSAITNFIIALTDK